MVNLKGRSFLKELDFTSAEWRHLLDLAAQLKAHKKAGTEVPHLAGKNIALLFEKTSTRTRCAFEVAAYDQGANVTYLDPTGSQLGHKESVADTARVLGRFYDGIEFRGHRQADVEELARLAGVPVWNGLTDEWHPTQTLADQLTMFEHAGRADYADITFAYVGDARNNVAHSLLVGAALLGMKMRVVAPSSLQPEPQVLAQAQALATQTGAQLVVSDDPRNGVVGCDFVYTDVWVSMGEPEEVWEERISLLQPYQVNREMLAATGKPAKFLHCLPAFHDRNTAIGEEIYQKYGLESMEVTNDVFESADSIVFDQAENRMHTIKAVMVATIGNPLI
ncbi:ornithine carbamoyltransferase [Actinobaculum suis]|uniref:ornithine carbamoyltransferase n=1 Tax=Actinobaculum suis TaxID=1657 RepID=UPI0008087165|nr:ornithine carbamoyltransferase [Actinobaculum suis]OCA94499.1 ornithine carbamoyltransferase [Actinobaculum suis]OCA94963.1 ornithine carbamoyltransferase [Actinobaculum suis]